MIQASLSEYEKTKSALDTPKANSLFWQINKKFFTLRTLSCPFFSPNKI